MEWNEMQGIRLENLVVEWNGMERNGMEWNTMKWNNKEWNGMEWSGVQRIANEWNEKSVVDCGGMERN